MFGIGLSSIVGGAFSPAERDTAYVLFSHDLLIVDQVTNWFTNNFEIHAPEGNVVGTILMDGDVLNSVFIGKRHFAIADSESGELVVRLEDVLNFGRDTYEVTTPEGALLTRIVKEIAIFQTVLTVSLSDGTEVEAVGDMFAMDFTLAGPEGRVATISRKWPTFERFLMHHERYVLAFAPGTSYEVRRAALGTAVAIDLIRRKRRRR